MKENTRLELAKDIVAFASVLTKFGGDSILENQTLFIESLNIAGFRTPTGKEFTKMGFRNMFSRLTPSEYREIIFEIKQMNRETDLMSVMFERW